MAYKSVGIIGAGVIGRALYDRVAKLGSIDVRYVLVSDRRKTPESDPISSLLIDDPDAAISREADLVLEAATPGVLAALAPRMLAHSDVCGFSCSALSDAAVEHAIRTAAETSGRRFFLPHGAVLGLDGLADGRDAIDTVTITTTKSGPSLGLSASDSGTIFDGSAREACERFPRNVNVHAAVALAGIGFDRTRSVVVADPETKSMRHRIEVVGQGLEWDITVRSQSLGGVTGSYTPKSAIGSLSRILGLSAVANV